MVTEPLDMVRKIFSTGLFEIGNTPITLMGLVRVALIVGVSWWVSKLIRRGLQRVARFRTGVSPSSFYALGRVLHYAIILLGLFIGLSTIGISFRNFAIVAGALGVGIGFGLQSIVNNFVAGLIILFEKSLKVDDFVELASGVVGRVREINFRSTRVTTNDNIDILVPNAEFVNGRVTNWTLDEEYRRIHVPFGVAYGTDKELVRKAGLEAAQAVPHTLTDVPQRGPQVVRGIRGQQPEFRAGCLAHTAGREAAVCGHGRLSLGDPHGPGEIRNRGPVPAAGHPRKEHLRLQGRRSRAPFQSTGGKTALNGKDRRKALTIAASQGSMT